MKGLAGGALMSATTTLIFSDHYLKTKKREYKPYRRCKFIFYKLHRKPLNNESTTRNSKNSTIEG